MYRIRDKSTGLYLKAGRVDAICANIAVRSKCWGTAGKVFASKRTLVSTVSKIVRRLGMTPDKTYYDLTLTKNWEIEKLVMVVDSTTAGIDLVREALDAHSAGMQQIAKTSPSLAVGVNAVIEDIERLKQSIE